MWGGLPAYDEGVSAFRSKNVDYRSALGSFLKQVEMGKVPKGSYLLVESLDRLSRAQVPTALSLFLGILGNGIIIVTLADGRRYSYESISDTPTELIISIIMMIRSHDESSIKSKRIRDLWANKRALAQATKQAMTRICPGWLELRDGRFKPIPGRDDIVRDIFQMCIDGVGTRTIAKTLNMKRTPLWGKGKKLGRIWHDSYIKKILENPAVYGEFTPLSKLAGGSDVEAQTPIPAYYPAVVDKDTFNRARVMLKARASSSVRSTAGKHRNVLSGLVKCSLCGGGMHYIDKGARGGKPHLRCGSSLLSGGCEHDKVHVYETLETDVVMHCSETIAEERSDHVVGIQACENALHEVTVRLERIADAVEELGLNETLSARLRALEKERTLAESALAKARNKADRHEAARTFRVTMREAADIAI